MRTGASPVWIWSASALAWGGVFALSCRLAVFPGDPEEGTRVSPSFAGALLSEGRLALHHEAYEMADTYFHKGVGHLHETAFHDHPFQRVRREVAPDRHVHLHGADVREILPWLWMAIRMDPSDVETRLVTAFWLAHGAGRPDLAEQVLREARVNTPGSVEVQLELGRLYLRQGRLADARRAFDAGLTFWPGKNKPDSREAGQDRAGLLLYRALLYEIEGKAQQAVRQYEEILALFPDRVHLRRRIEALQKEEAPAIVARDFLENLLDQQARLKEETCSRVHGHGHGHDTPKPHAHHQSAHARPSSPTAGPDSP